MTGIDASNSRARAWGPKLSQCGILTKSATPFQETNMPAIVLWSMGLPNTCVQEQNIHFQLPV